MRIYSSDLRGRIVAARAQGHSAAETARLFKVSKRSVERYGKLQATNGSLQPKRRGGYRRSRLERPDETVRRWIQEQPDLTLAELQQRLARKLQVRLGLTACSPTSTRLNWPFPNSKPACGNRRNAPAPACAAPPHKPSIPSPPHLALTPFAMPNMRQIKRKLL